MMLSIICLFSTKPPLGPGDLYVFHLLYCIKNLDSWISSDNEILSCWEMTCGICSSSSMMSS
jgi:hypothetical protein